MQLQSLIHDRCFVIIKKEKIVDLWNDFDDNKILEHVFKLLTTF